MTVDIASSGATELAAPMLSYGSYVGGKDIEGSKWVYVLSARSMLDDVFASLTLKRKLERGRLPDSAALPGIVAGRVAVADEATIALALSTAAAAAAEWRKVPTAERVDDLLRLVGENVAAKAEQIERMLTLEGHPLEVARWEISGILEVSRPEAREYLRGQLWSEYSRDGRRLIIRRQPDGVVCVNPPANAPMMSALLGALSIGGGNAVVVRAPRTAPLGVMWGMRELIVPALEAIGAPPGVLSVLCGHPGPLLDAWLESPHVNDIMHFGGSESGLQFERKCLDAGKKPILELAGNDVVVVWSDANLDHAASALIECFFGSGQLCMNPNQVLVHPAVADELIRRVAEKAHELRPGYPDEEGVLLTPVLRYDGFHQALTDAVDNGAVIVTGGAAFQSDGNQDSSGIFLQPTVIRIDGVAKARELDAVKHESFFPLLPVVVPDPATDDELLDQFIEFVNTNLYGLRNSLWAADKYVVDRFVAEVNNGGLLKVNSSHLAFTGPLPTHGGTGLTGGVHGEANYPILRTTRLQGVAISSPDTPPRVR